MTLEEIMDKVASFNPRYVTVTGGEPLAQKSACEQLLTLLCNKGYKVSIETSGAMDVSGVDPRVTKVVDLKTPDSGELEKNLWSNLQHLNEQDEIKFVICSRKDYDWARMKLDECNLPSLCDVLFSPCHGRQSATQLADWIIEDNLTVRFQLQLHKLLWNDEPGH